MQLNDFCSHLSFNIGAYLVRESDRKPGSYVLSYLGKTGINHFRITAVCGDFYIGGRQFDSLQVKNFIEHIMFFCFRQLKSM